MSGRTHSLFHFTKEFSTLQNILKSGVFWPRYSLEDLSWAGNAPFHLAFPMVSFCDIPITRINEHTAYYGDYGIGLTQDWGRLSGLNPLLYINDKAAFAAQLHQTLDTTVGEAKDNVDDPFYQALHILAFTKPMTGTMRKSGPPDTKDFYSESEWRYVPAALMKTEMCYLDEERYVRSDERKKADDASLAQAPLAFSVTDIRYLFVKTVSEIPFLVDFINSNLGHYPANHLKILCSRIVSLEDLRYDL